MPELPDERKARYKNDFGLSDYDAGLLAEDKGASSFYEAAISFDGFKDKAAAYKLVANWVIGDLFAAMNAGGVGFDDLKVPPSSVARVVALIQDGTISGKIAKTVFERLWQEPLIDPLSIVQNMGITQISDEAEISSTVKQVLLDNEKSVADYRNGKVLAFGFLVGQVMKRFAGRANPALVNEILRKELGNG
jgi:aspartyl-tRNA(Asn)/glutamyl-tRNA(Gln) amidotransferase subunit B